MRYKMLDRTQKRVGHGGKEKCEVGEGDKEVEKRGETRRGIIYLHERLVTNFLTKSCLFAYEWQCRTMCICILITEIGTIWQCRQKIARFKFVCDPLTSLWAVAPGCEVEEEGERGAAEVCGPTNSLGCVCWPWGCWVWLWGAEEVAPGCSEEKDCVWFMGVKVFWVSGNSCWGTVADKLNLNIKLSHTHLQYT